MVEYNQGDNYEEEDFDDTDLDEEGSEDTEAQIRTIYGMPIKTVAMLGVGVLLVLLVIIIFSTRSKRSKEDDIVAGGTGLMDTTYTDVVDDTYVDTSQDFYDPAPSSNLVATMDPDTGEIVYVDLNEQETEPEETEEVTVDSFSTEDQIMLRSLGYTGDEIQFCIDNGFSVQDLVDAAKAKHDEESAESLHRMSDQLSPEFKYILDNTYIGQPAQQFVGQSDLPVTDKIIVQGSYTVNADYVKCPEYGLQLYLKCQVARGTYIWYMIDPMRYEQLPQEGNIVLRVNYVNYGDNTYVTNITETDPTLETIDSSDALPISEDEDQSDDVLDTSDAPDVQSETETDN